jgi:predicted DNA-binding antitoxin AbrB/MazE fold protein
MAVLRVNNNGPYNCTAIHAPITMTFRPGLCLTNDSKMIRMSQEFHAIYEHGILRPLTPLNLPESAEVAGILHETQNVQQITDPLLGLMADEPELLDQVIDDAMIAREAHSFR